ncbi:NUDIX domain-containing protein [Maritimibacter fusiformis]|uniref:ADP-ribose pyrophosphatase n=1 Tax=Maritimibacter fusiformis TaxID=2603819 RepID=A0A5D0RK59_9RHOB|nr:NUDIX domain-containing protein [Maritimibacter fusiformis]TYB81296.1 NUDIX domain-containing protein [Maritimibacter fusiformis]
MSELPLFLFGTLCHDGLRAAVLGPGAGEAVPATLPGHAVCRVRGEAFPMLVPGERAQGLLITPDAEARARADFFELGFGYRLRKVSVETAAGPAQALAYFPENGANTPDGPWRLEDWARDWADIWIAAAAEAVGYFGAIAPEDLARRWPTITMRAASRVRARAPAPTTLRSRFASGADVEKLRLRRPYCDYFMLEEQDLRHRRFDGGMSPVVTRAGFVGGDAATVLPYDPARDEVLVIEQFRAAPYLRGDPHPWTLEPIAGRIDAGETPQDCARREAREEAGLAVGALHDVAEYYPSPGAVAEFIFSYVGIADLAGRDGETGGVDHEDEDIRAHVIGFDRLMQLVESGEAGTGPLVMSAYWLALHRDRLRG